MISEIPPVVPPEEEPEDSSEGDILSMIKETQAAFDAVRGLERLGEAVGFAGKFGTAMELLKKEVFDPDPRRTTKAQEILTRIKSTVGWIQEAEKITSRSVTANGRLDEGSTMPNEFRNDSQYVSHYGLKGLMQKLNVELDQVIKEFGN